MEPTLPASNPINMITGSPVLRPGCEQGAHGVLDVPQTECFHISTALDRRLGEGNEAVSQATWSFSDSMDDGSMTTWKRWSPRAAIRRIACFEWRGPLFREAGSTIEWGGVGRPSGAASGNDAVRAGGRDRFDEGPYNSTGSTLTTCHISGAVCNKQYRMPLPRALLDLSIR